MSARQRGSSGPRKRIGRVVSETPIADFLTVCWMLAVTTALLCELGSGIGALALTRAHDSRSLQSLVDVLLFAALVVGSLAVALLPIVRRVRKTLPPGPIAWLAVIVGLAPIMIMLIRAVL